MDPLADYPPPLKYFNPIRKMAISGRTRMICYQQTIYDDSCWERNEFFSLTLTVQDESAVTTVVDPLLSRAVVKIVDDDCELHAALLLVTLYMMNCFTTFMRATML